MRLQKYNSQSINTDILKNDQLIPNLKRQVSENQKQFQKQKENSKFLIRNRRAVSQKNQLVTDPKIKIFDIPFKQLGPQFSCSCKKYMQKTHSHLELTNNRGNKLNIQKSSDRSLDNVEGNSNFQDNHNTENMIKNKQSTKLKQNLSKTEKIQQQQSQQQSEESSEEQETPRFLLENNIKYKNFSNLLQKDDNRIQQSNQFKSNLESKYSTNNSNHNQTCRYMSNKFQKNNIQKIGSQTQYDQAFKYQVQYQQISCLSDQSQNSSVGFKRKNARSLTQPKQRISKIQMNNDTILEKYQEQKYQKFPQRNYNQRQKFIQKSNINEENRGILQQYQYANIMSNNYLLQDMKTNKEKYLFKNCSIRTRLNDFQRIKKSSKINSFVGALPINKD